MKKVYLLYIVLLFFTQKSNAQTVSTFAGIQVAGYSGDNGIATDAKIDNPYGIVTDDEGNVYFTDQGNAVIRKVDAVTKVITTVVSSDIFGEGILPNELAIDGDVIYFLDNAEASNRIMSFSINDFEATTVVTLTNDYIGLCVKGDLIYLTNMSLHTIDLYTMSTDIVSVYSGTPGTIGNSDGPIQSAKYNMPLAIAFDENSHLVLTDFADGTVRRIDLDNLTVTTIANGLAAPEGIAVGTDGTIYIASKVEHKIKIIPPNSNLMEFAGSGEQGYQDGPVETAKFDTPAKITVDNENNIYVSDKSNNLIRHIGCEAANPAPLLVSTNSQEFCVDNQEEFYIYIDSDIADLKDNENWVWYKGACGEEEIYVGDTLYVNPSETTMYGVRGEGGCFQSGECQEITLNAVTCDSMLEPDNSITTAFSPNNDGVNDVWIINEIEQYSENKVYIYNRWGDLVYFTDNYNNKDNVWNGDSFNLNQKVSPGTYFYLIESNGVKVANGWVQVIR